MQKFIVFSLAFFVVTLTMYILGTAYTFFMPLVVALVIAYALITLADSIKRIAFDGWHVPTSLAYFSAILVMLAFVWIVFQIVTSNVVELMFTAPVYQSKLQSLVARISNLLPIDAKPDFTNFADQFDFVSMLTGVLGVLTDIASYAGMIALYVIFILIEHSYLDDKINAFFMNSKGADDTRSLIMQILAQIKSYVRIKTMLSFVTAFLSYCVLVSVGVDFPDFWAFLIFILNFIPTIGSILATIFPCLLAILQFDNLLPFAVVTTFLIAIQFLVGNILEPRIMGKSFNLSGLVIILSLTVWGRIWGVIGMFLCVPIMVILSIILANFQQTRPIAVLLSQDGKLKQNQNE